MTHQTLTGYGSPAYRGRLVFDGDERKYELWEIKFLGYMRIQKLNRVITADENDAIDAAKNEESFAELVQCLDDRSLSLIIRDAKNDGRKALRILREHYLSKGKPRIISLYTELTSLKKATGESVTDYMIRAETAATSLKTAGETISDSLLVAMVLKGLPPEFKPFITVITQKEKSISFSEFKVSLRSFEETENAYLNENKEETVMKANFKPKSGNYYGHSDSHGNSRPTGSGSNSADNQGNFYPTGRGNNSKCFVCGKLGHRAADCYSKYKKRWCDICKNRSHDTNWCRKKNDKVKSMENSDSDHSFAFKVSMKKDDFNSVNKVKGMLVDCGATTHIVNDITKFISFDEHFNPAHHVIELADGTRVNNIALKRGSASISLIDSNGNEQKGILENSLYVPSFEQNIFSVQAATDKGASVEFNKECAKLVNGDGTIFNIQKHGRLYFLDTVNTVPVKNVSYSLKEWHKVLGHCNVRDIIRLKDVVNGMNISDKSVFDCDTCFEGKMTQYRNREPDKKANAILELVHCDLAGPIDPVAKDGFRYALGFIDDYSGIIMVYFLKEKSDTIHATEKFLADCAPYGSVKCIRSDNGGEFTSKAFESILVKHSIKHEKSAPYSPHQNGTIERAWRSIFEMARCMLLESKLQKCFWTYAVMSTVYIRNRCFNDRLKKTPFEVFTGAKPDISNMHIFGSVCYAYVQQKKKLDARSEKGIFVGYDKGSPSYLVYFPNHGEIKKVRCVKFTNNFEIPGNSVGNPTDIPYDDVNFERIRKPVSEEKPLSHLRENCNEVIQPQCIEGVAGEEVSAKPSRYPNRERVKPKYLNEFMVGNDIDDVVDYTVDYCCTLMDLPKSYEEAIASTNSCLWQKAMEDEMRALEENDTYELVPLPEGRKSVGGRWVFSVKLHANGEEKCKARFVAKGYSQLPDVDYHETFSPTARITSIRTLMQLAVQHDLFVHQMDVKTAFLNAPIDCELYIEQPNGFVIEGKNGEKLVGKLKKSLYGLKQSGRNWYSLLSSCLTDLNFSQSLVDPCVFTRHNNEEITIIIVWVDDILIGSNCMSFLTDIKNCLNVKFQMKDLGEISSFLGIKFTRENNVIKMSQSKYVEKLLTKFNMYNCKPRSTPCEMGVNKYAQSDDDLADAKLYREMVGSLIYIMTSTRPDLCYIVTTLSQYMARPTIVHLTMAKHVLRYLKGTIDQCLIFKKSANLSLIGFCDADWGNSVDRRSITGYVFSLSSNSSSISWKSRKQQTVALSTCEAEYMSMAAAVQEAKFLLKLLSSMLGNVFSGVTLFCDNQGALALAKNPIQHQRSKHIDIKYHFIRSEIQNGVVNIEYVPSEHNVSDLFTKPVSSVKLKRFSNALMGRPI